MVNGFYYFIRKKGGKKRLKTETVLLTFVRNGVENILIVKCSFGHLQSIILTFTMCPEFGNLPAYSIKVHIRFSKIPNQTMFTEYCIHNAYFCQSVHSSHV